MAEFEALFDLSPREPIEASFDFQEQNQIDATFSLNIIPEIHNDLIDRDKEDCHPISAITGLRQALDTFVFEQGVASNVWEIEHNLGKYPSVSIVDTAGNEIIASVKYPDENNVVITMTSEFKGKAYLN